MTTASDYAPAAIVAAGASALSDYLPGTTTRYRAELVRVVAALMYPYVRVAATADLSDQLADGGHDDLVAALDGAAQAYLDDLMTKDGTT